MGKIMDKLKHHYNAFQELQTKFFHKQCVIWSFPPSFNEFHYNFHIFKISGTINNEEKSYNKRYLPLSFSKYAERSPKLVYFKEISGTVMRAKIQLISMQNAKVPSHDSSPEKEPLWGQMGKIICKLKHNYNKFQELRTKFFHKQWVIWSFLPSFNEFHHKLHIFKTSGTILDQLTMKKIVTTRGISH